MNSTSKSEGTQPKTVLYDIETSPRLVWVWDEYEQNVIQVEQESYILCFSYKLLGEKKTHVVSLNDFPLYKKDKKNDRELVKKLHEIQDSSDVVIGHNSDRFDNKWSNRQFLKHGLGPVAPFQSIDTLKLARRFFRFHSNALGKLGVFLGVGNKVSHQGVSMWFKVMEGDKKAWKEMKKYAKQDVVLLERVYLKLRPWMKDNVYYNESFCNRCEGELNKRGFQESKSGMTYQRYQCKSCDGWSRSRIGERTSKPIMSI